jgi:hypothetical protein
MVAIIAAALQLLTHLLEVAKAYLELKASREKNDQTASKHRPRHLRE